MNERPHFDMILIKPIGKTDFIKIKSFHVSVKFLKSQNNENFRKTVQKIRKYLLRPEINRK